MSSSIVVPHGYVYLVVYNMLLTRPLCFSAFLIPVLLFCPLHLCLPGKPTSLAKHAPELGSNILKVMSLFFRSESVSGRSLRVSRIAYAENAAVEASREALIFNCAQRAHQNTLETLPVILITSVSLKSYFLCLTVSFMQNIDHGN